MRAFSTIPGSVVRFETTTEEGVKLLHEARFGADGWLDSDDELLFTKAQRVALGKMLAGIADRPGTSVRTKSDEDIDAEVNERMLADQRAAAAAAHAKMVAAGEKTA